MRRGRYKQTAVSARPDSRRPILATLSTAAYFGSWRSAWPPKRLQQKTYGQKAAPPLQVQLKSARRNSLYSGKMHADVRHQREQHAASKNHVTKHAPARSSYEDHGLANQRCFQLSKVAETIAAFPQRTQTNTCDRRAIKEVGPQQFSGARDVYDGAKLVALH